MEPTFIMPLLLRQLIFTSFPKSGFKLLTSPQVPKKIQQAFINEVVYKHWDSYNPPNYGYRAAYLHQVTPKDSLFGWLYNQKMDDLGRGHVPYFLCYYLTELLDTVQLEIIFACLHNGPLAIIDQQSLPPTLSNIVVPDLLNYQPALHGVAIPSTVCKKSKIELQQNKMLSLFISSDSKEMTTQSNKEQVSLKQVSISNYTRNKSILSPPVFCPKNQGSPGMNTGKIERILQELVSKPGIQGAVLVSSDGQPITASIGMDYDSASIMAATILSLAGRTREEFNWHSIEKISIQAQEGHIILTVCDRDVFLLVKAGRVMMGLLNGEINRTVKKLQVQLQRTEEAEGNGSAFPMLEVEILSQMENRITYRGRPTQ